MTMTITVHTWFGERQEGLRRLARQLLLNHGLPGPETTIHLSLRPVAAGPHGPDILCRLTLHDRPGGVIVLFRHPNASHAILGACRQARALVSSPVDHMPTVA